MSQPPTWGDLPSTWGQMEAGAQSLSLPGTTVNLYEYIYGLLDAAFVKNGQGQEITWSLVMQALPAAVSDPETGQQVFDDQSRPLQSWNPMCLIYVSIQSLTIGEIHWRCSNPQLIWDWSEQKAEIAARELVGILLNDRATQAARAQQQAAPGQNGNGVPPGLIVPGR